MNGYKRKIIYGLVTILLILQGAITRYGFAQLDEIQLLVSKASVKIARIEGFLNIGKYPEWNLSEKLSSLKGQESRME